MNKTDLRYQKTEIAIKESYHKLKKRGSSTVSVKDLCDEAMINKTTFYSHYETIEALHNQMRAEFVADMLEHCDSIDNIQTDTSGFVVSIYRLFSGSTDTIEQLYGTDFNSLVNDVENMLMDHFDPTRMDEDTKLKIQFCIGGAFRILLYETAPDCIQKTVELVEKVLA